MSAILLQIHTEGNPPTNWYWADFTAYNKRFYAEIKHVSVMHPYLDLDVGYTQCVIHPYRFDMIDRDEIMFEKTDGEVCPVRLASCIQEFANQPCIFKMVEE